MKSCRKIWVILLCLIVIGFFLLSKWLSVNTGRRLAESKPEKQSYRTGEASTPLPQTMVKEAAALGGVGTIPTEADRMAQIYDEIHANLINEWGDPNSTTIALIVGWQEVDLTFRVKAKLQAAMKEISVILKRRNMDVAPLPWKAGMKFHFKGLAPDELLAIKASLQAALMGMVTESVLEQIIKRFSEETKIYTHSLDAEVVENTELLTEQSKYKGGVKVIVKVGAGGRMWAPVWYRVVEKDRDGITVSDKKFTDNLGPLGNQMLPTQQ